MSQTLCFSRRKVVDLWLVQIRNVLCKLDHSPGKARANFKGGEQKRYFAIIAGPTCKNRKRMPKNVLLDRSSNTKNNKASDAVSKRHQQLQSDHDIARTRYFRPGHHMSFR